MATGEYTELGDWFENKQDRVTDHSVQLKYKLRFRTGNAEWDGPRYPGLAYVVPCNSDGSDFVDWRTDGAAREQGYPTRAGPLSEHTYSEWAKMAHGFRVLCSCPEGFVVLQEWEACAFAAAEAAGASGWSVRAPAFDVTTLCAAVGISLRIEPCAVALPDGGTPAVMSCACMSAVHDWLCVCVCALNFGRSGTVLRTDSWFHHRCTATVDSHQ